MALRGETKEVSKKQLATAIRDLNAVRKMVEEEKYCIDVLNQLKIVQSALDTASQQLLKQHLETCVVEAVKSYDSARVLEELWQVLRKNVEFSVNTSFLLPATQTKDCCG